MAIHNRDAFLATIAGSLGRSVRTIAERPTWQFQPQHEILKDATQDELVEVLKKQCENIHTLCYTTTKEQLPEVLTQVVEELGSESIIQWKDERYEQQFGIGSTLNRFAETGIELYEWNEKTPAENIRQAEKAKIGIVISEMTLAESASAVLYSHKNRGRTMNFLPENIIVLIPKSTIVPRITQAATALHKQVQRGEKVPSCILFMTGPSNSADIEMVLIVGVHGPVKARYIVVEDL